MDESLIAIRIEVRDEIGAIRLDERVLIQLIGFVGDLFGVLPGRDAVTDVVVGVGVGGSIELGGGEF